MSNPSTNRTPAKTSKADELLEQLRQRGVRVFEAPWGWITQCPNHGWAYVSVLVWRDSGGITCWDPCTPGEVYDALRAAA